MSGAAMGPLHQPLTHLRRCRPRFPTDRAIGHSGHRPGATTTMKTTNTELAALQAAMAEQFPGWLTLAQRKAREEFDLKAALECLPAWGTVRNDGGTRDHDDHRGNAGTRLRPHLRSDLDDDLLREFAWASLGAQRCSMRYLDALRVVLGNQAHAERHGYLLEMNLRATFATERTMRTIIDQMRAAGITFGKAVHLGGGRIQVVQCFGRRRRNCTEATAAEELERLYRLHEDGVVACAQDATIQPEDVPY